MGEFNWWIAIVVSVVLTKLLEWAIRRWVGPWWGGFRERRRQRKYARDQVFMQDVARAWARPSVAIALIGKAVVRSVVGILLGCFLVLGGALLAFREPLGSWTVAATYVLVVLGLVMFQLGTRDLARVIDLANMLIELERRETTFPDWKDIDLKELRRLSRDSDSKSS